MSIPYRWLLVAVFALSSCATARTEPKSPKRQAHRCPDLTMEFVVDRDYDAHTIYSILHGKDPAGLISRAASMGIGRRLADAIHAAPTYDSVADPIRSAVDSRYAEIGRNMARARGAYEGAWAHSVRKAFSDRIVSVTAHCWVHGRYRVVVSAFHPGLSSWSGDIVASRFDHDLSTKRRIVAHEIVLSQLFQLFRSEHAPAEVGDWSVWAFAEITAAILLGDPALQHYWPEFPVVRYFAGSNYPQLAAVEKELRRRFRERESFDQYMSDAVSLLKKLDRDRGLPLPVR